MPSMGGGAAAGLQDVLRQLFLETQLKQQARNQEEQRALQSRGLDLDQQRLQQQGTQFDARLGLDRDEFGFEQERAGVADQRYEGEAPARAADVAYKGALTGELIRKPTAEQQDREFTTTRDKTLHGYRTSEIAARSADSRAGDWQLVTHVNPQTQETATFRINKLTGEKQKVEMTDGFQPGGARQTRLSAGQQDDLSTMATVQDMSKAVLELGNSINWKGVGGLMGGTRGQFMMKQFGVGDPREEVLRNTIGNIQGTIAKLRGGTSFTANEQKLLDSYTPTGDEDPKAIVAKLTSLGQFIDMKRRNTMQFAGSPMPAAGAQDGASPPAKDPLGIR